MKRRASAGISGGFLLVCCLASPAEAAPLFYVQATGGAGESSASAVSESSDFSRPTTLTNAFGLHSAQGFAAAGPGGLGASGRQTISASGARGGIDSSSGIPSGGGTAEMTFTDFVITGGAGGSTLASLNLDLSGTSAANVIAFPTGPFTSDSFATANLLVSIFVAGQYSEGTRTLVNHNGDLSPTTGGDIDLTGNVLTTPLLSLPVGNPFAVTVSLEATGSVFAQVSGGPAGEPEDGVTLSLDALSAFENTLTFATSRPVFNLEPGLTVNSPDAQVVDNHYVPEPGTAPALALGLLGLAVMRRRRTGR